VDLALIFSEALRDLPEPFEQRLGDALQGEANLFTREDGVEKTWRIVQPLLDSPPPVETYAPGSWGTGRDRQTPRLLPPLARTVVALAPDALKSAVSGCGRRNWARSDAKFACRRDRFHFPHPEGGENSRSDRGRDVRLVRSSVRFLDLVAVWLKRGGARPPV
jgi:hypothetical protein